MNKRRHDNDSGPIPKRWLNCPMKCDEFVLNKFVAFKTPLSEKFDDKVHENVFYPSMIFDYVKTYYKKKVGLWIDLTNTSRFYDSAVVERRDCKYVKMNCRGHGETPSPEQTERFIQVVDDFVSQNPLELVAVHCTHGFNRTGFLIASYLVEKNDIAVEAAIQMFAKARPPGIYKQDYIKELYKRYDDEEDATDAPPLPDWCYEEEEEEADFENGNEDLPDGAEMGETSRKKRRQEEIKMDAEFMKDVPGVELLTERNRVNALREVIQNMCEFRKGGFPGAQPVSMDRQNIELLHQKPYRVSWKADGTRYMMLIQQKSEIFFFDRDNSVFKVDNLKLPHEKDLTKHLKNCLLDGEMVIDRVQGKKVPRYLVYDMICYEGEDFSKKSFDERLAAVSRFIIAPRHEAMKRGIINREREPFSVRKKDFWPITQAASLLGPKFAQQLSHKPDGLIFQPAMEPYVGGRCDDILKWKPAHLNSVDFLLKIVEESGVGMLTTKKALLYVGHMDAPFSAMKYNKSLRDFHNKIVECKYENNQWVFMRERTDKSYPNAYNTATAVCNSIKYPVTQENLLVFIEKRRFREDAEQMQRNHHN